MPTWSVPGKAGHKHGGGARKQPPAQPWEIRRRLAGSARWVARQLLAAASAMGPQEGGAEERGWEGHVQL